MRRLIVTGGAGFIGSNFIHRWIGKFPEDIILNLDCLTYAGDLKNLDGVRHLPNLLHYPGDIRSREDIKEALNKFWPCTDIIAFAASSHVDKSISGPEEFVQTNVVGTFNLLEECRQKWVTEGTTANAKFLYISTDEVFGALEQFSEGKFYEYSPYDPSSPYSASKAAAEHFVNAYKKTYGLNTFIVNCSNNYGPRQHGEKLIPTAIRCLASKKPVPIYGAGNNIRDWIYVDDCCDAIITVFNADVLWPTTMNRLCIGGNCEKSNFVLVRKIIKTMNDLTKLEKYKSFQNEVADEMKITFVPDRLGHDFRYALSTDTIYNCLCWKPIIGLDQGLLNTVSWYLDKFLEEGFYHEG